MNSQIISIVYFILFLLFLIVIAIWAGKKNKMGGSGENVEFFLGGKSTPMVVLAVSYCAAAVSAGSFMGDPGLMSTIGWPYYWIAVFVVPGLTIPGIFIIRKMRLQSERYGALTVTEYIGARFDSPGLKLYLSILITICYVFMLVAQFKGAAVLLQTYTGINFNVGLLVMTLVSLYYVNAGGLRSVAWTEFLQGMLMIIMCLVLITVALKTIGGFSGLEAKLAVEHPEMLKVVEPNEKGNLMPWTGVIGTFFFGFFIMFSQPHVTQRYLALPDINRKSIGSFLLISLVTGFLFNLMFVLGPVGRLLHPDVPADYITVTLSSTLLHPLVAGILMIGFFSAILSTATGIMMIVGQSVGHDIYGQLAKNPTPKKEVSVTRWATTAVVALVLLFNFVNPPAFLQVFIYLGLTGIGAGICMPLFAGVLWKKASKEGAIVSAVAGPAGYLVHVNLLGQSWAWGMGTATIWAIVAFFVVTWIRNAVKGVDPHMAELWDPLGGPVKTKATVNITD